MEDKRLTSFTRELLISALLSTLYILYTLIHLYIIYYNN